MLTPCDNAFNTRCPGPFASRAHRLTRGYAHWCQPSKPIGLQPVCDPEELIGNLLRDLAGLAVGYHHAVDGTYRRNLCGGSGEEYFVCDIEQFAGHRLFD